MGGESELGELTLGLRAGRPEAWDRLYTLTHLPILRQLRRALRDDDRAEEALQAAFVTAVEKFSQFNPSRGSVDAWLAGIARHKVQEMRRERRLASLFDGPVPGEAVPDPAATDAERIALALDQLEPRYAEVLRRKFIANEPLEAIARGLGLKESTVGTLIHRGKERFREVYERLSMRAQERPAVSCGLRETVK